MTDGQRTRLGKICNALNNLGLEVISFGGDDKNEFIRIKKDSGTHLILECMYSRVDGAWFDVVEEPSDQYNLKQVWDKIA